MRAQNDKPKIGGKVCSGEINDGLTKHLQNELPSQDKCDCIKQLSAVA